jgi:opacity protein-like surface antigen
MRLSLTSAGLALLLLAAAAPSAAAQATRDQARLMLTVAPGYMFGSDLWEVSGQPLVDAEAGGALVDLVTLDREIRPTLGVSFSGAYFPGDHWGFGAEAFLVGLGYRDDCTQTTATGSAQNAAVCESLKGAERAASAVVLSGNVIYRIRSRQTISPYARAGLGMALSTQSSLRVNGEIRRNDGNVVDVPVYVDETDTRLTPSAALAVGFTAALAPGYQLRWELRDQITGVRVVDGPTELSPAVPPSSLEFRHILGMTIGLDVVLERRRGRRY